MFLNGLHQFDLGAAAVEVVSLSVNFEVDVALQIIGEETGSDFKGDEFAAEGQIVFFSRSQEARRRIKITAQKCFKHFKLHIDL